MMAGILFHEGMEKFGVMEMLMRMMAQDSLVLTARKRFPLSGAQQAVRVVMCGRRRNWGRARRAVAQKPSGSVRWRSWTSRPGIAEPLHQLGDMKKVQQEVTEHTVITTAWPVRFTRIPLVLPDFFIRQKPLAQKGTSVAKGCTGGGMNQFHMGSFRLTKRSMKSLAWTKGRLKRVENKCR